MGSFPEKYNDPKILGLICICGAFFNSHMPNPSPFPPHKQGLTRVSRIFPKFQLCIGWGEEKLQDIFKKVALIMRAPRNYRKPRILHYCPTDFCPGL